MSIIGYARVSTTDQKLEVQEDALRAAGCNIIRAEKISGTKTAGREKLATILDFIQEGDILVVTKVDRLARSLGDLLDIVRNLEGKGASLRVLNAQIDTGTPSGRAFLGMLGVFAEFETNLRKERQMEGIAKAKKAGVYKGRPAKIDNEVIRQMKAAGKGPSKIARELGVCRASVYRALAHDAITPQS